MKKLVTAIALVATVATVAVGSAASPTAAQAASPVIECGHVRINEAVGLVNITTRRVGCGTAYAVARAAYSLSNWSHFRSIFLETLGGWHVQVTKESANTIADTGVWYDERATSSGGRVVRFQIYFE
jgi:hypothetical protein